MKAPRRGAKVHVRDKTLTERQAAQLARRIVNAYAEILSAIRELSRARL